MTPPVLILTSNPGRLSNVLEIIDGAKVAGRKVYLYVDNTYQEAEKIIGPCRELVDMSIVSCKRSGILYAMPNAICWAMAFLENSSDRLIILEDDCIPNENFWRFMDIKRSTGECISGFNPFKSPDNLVIKRVRPDWLSIWGWSISRKAWEAYYMRHKSTLKFKVKASRKQYVESKIEEKVSWDYEFCLWAIENLSIYCPTHNTVENVGRYDGEHGMNPYHCNAYGQAFFVEDTFVPGTLPVFKAIVKRNPRLYLIKKAILKWLNK